MDRSVVRRESILVILAEQFEVNYVRGDPSCRYSFDS